ncbi:MAG: OmpH family outer membrane protein [Hyphomonadaceae bacterium]
MSTFSAAALAAAALVVSSDALAQRNRNSGSTTAVVLNYQRVAAESALGRDMQAKLAALQQQFAGEAQALAPEQQSLEQERQRVAQATRNLSPEQIRSNAQYQQFAQRLQQFEGRAGQLRGDLECSQAIALRDFGNQISPVVRSVMQARGAGIVINASNASEVLPEFDITSAVVQQLDQGQNTRVANVTRHSISECQGQQPAPAPAQ